LSKKKERGREGTRTTQDIHGELRVALYREDMIVDCVHLVSSSGRAGQQLGVRGQLVDSIPVAL